jgi:hypothetical protein
MASDLVSACAELDIPKASDGDGYYYRYACYRRGNNNSVCGAEGHCQKLQCRTKVFEMQAAIVIRNIYT